MTTKAWIAISIFATFFVVILIPGGEHLALGWLYFPMRVLPRVTADVPAAILGLLCCFGFIAGLHLLLRRWTDASRKAVGQAAWKWRTTFAVSGLVLLLFVAGTAMVGATHQLIWLFSRRGQPREGTFGIYDSAREAARQSQVTNNLKSIALGVQNFHDTFQAFPPGGTMTDDGELLHGWTILVGPFMAFHGEGIDYSIPWNRPPNDRFYKCNLRMFVNPSLRGPYFDEQGFGLAHVAGNVHVLPIMTVKRDSFKAEEHLVPPMLQLSRSRQLINGSQITDGTSNTLLIGSVSQHFKPWGHPANVRDPAAGIDRSPDGFGGPPSWNGAVFAFCDGHTALINRKIDPRVLKQLGTPAGGETVPSDYGR